MVVTITVCANCTHRGLMCTTRTAVYMQQRAATTTRLRVPAAGCADRRHLPGLGEESTPETEEATHLQRAADVEYRCIFFAVSSQTRCEQSLCAHASGASKRDMATSDPSASACHMHHAHALDVRWVTHWMALGHVSHYAG